jgi:hypothetical protein
MILPSKILSQAIVPYDLNNAKLLVKPFLQVHSSHSALRHQPSSFQSNLEASLTPGMDNQAILDGMGLTMIVIDWLLK